ncbi:hypothetical protein NQ318_009529 [Aromia moschata]|uniref:Uncharacterized protein n=1 Tax=Aromia moschata TaxID=1265417 RepID=A0AAV8XDQ6_9CUCU|nr:hypothetical protein NQ318_009529 [Aromia moschata]
MLERVLWELLVQKGWAPLCALLCQSCGGKLCINVPDVELTCSDDEDDTTTDWAPLSASITAIETPSYQAHNRSPERQEDENLPPTKWRLGLIVNLATWFE